MFCRLLNHIADITHNSKSDELWRFLDAVYHSNVPDPGGALQVPFNNGHDVSVNIFFVKEKMILHSPLS